MGKMKRWGGAMVRINLGLQGGGAHGAFTWGVLDRLLEEPGIEIAGISGTSAGALNGAALKAGWLRGGAQGARDNLDWLWAQMGALDDALLPGWFLNALPDPGLVSHALEWSPLYQASDMLARMGSPYAAGPLYRNPLERVVAQFDFDQVCAEAGPRLFVGATCVRDGKIRVFAGDQITTQSILASACLPTLFQAVECPDPDTGVTEAFWDGGYSGNPALFPLFARDLPDDIVVININPLVRDSVPKLPNEIQNRINEISFNSSLLRELRAIAFVQRLQAEGTIAPGAMKALRLHMIADDALMNSLSVATKLVPLPGVLAQLKTAGRRAAGRFLADHGADLGRRQSADIRSMFG